jgi:hypothetical protein
MLVRAGVALGLFAALAVSPATAKCERTNYQANPATASRSEVQMSASSGMDCVIRLALPKRYKLTGRRITEKPTNGIVSIEGQTAFYRSVPGYTGPDRFVVEISGKAFDGAGTAVIVVNVTVE